MAEVESSAAKITTAHIELVFSGEAFRAGTIDARVLGSALTAYSEVFNRANFLINGRNAEPHVQVDGNFKTGSFDVSLLFDQGILQQVQGVIGNFSDTLQILTILGFIYTPDSLIELLKFLKGAKPDKVIEVNGRSQVEINGVKKVVNNYAINFYGDAAIRKGLANGMNALQLPGAETISFKHEGSEPEIISKEEAPAFKADEFALEEDQQYSGERDAVLTIAKLAFKQGSKWNFFENGASLSAKIEDDDFFRDVHDRKFKFADGDRLHVHLMWNLVNKGGRLVAENVITKVHKILAYRRQIRLDGENDDLV